MHINVNFTGLYAKGAHLHCVLANNIFGTKSFFSWLQTRLSAHVKQT